MAEIATERRKKPSKPRSTEPQNGSQQPQTEEVPKQISFFQRIAAVPSADWGTRCKVTIYRLEPLIDQNRSSGRKYITVYNDEPPTEERIKQDHGSGRYRLYFGMKTAGSSVEREVDSVEIDILDPKFPPKLNLGDWLDDPKNRKWNWAKAMLEAEATKTAAAHPAQPANTANVVLEAMATVADIQDRTIERMRPANQPAATDPIDAATKILALTKEAKSDKPALDPFEAVERVIKITQGGGQTALLDMMSKQLEHAVTRAEKLEDELRTAKNPAPVAPKSLLEQINELGQAVEGLKKIGVVSGSDPKETVITRSKMGPWMEFFQPVLPELAGIVKTVAQPLMQVAAQGMIMKQQEAARAQQMQRPPQAQALPPTPHAPGSTPAPQPAATPQTAVPESQPAQAQPQPTADQQAFADFITMITPPMLKHLQDGLDGEEFASFIADGWGIERVQQMQSAPVDQIVIFYKTTPWWQVLQHQETQFLKFLNEFKVWKPGEDEEDETESSGGLALVSTEAGNDDEEGEEIG